MLLFHTLLNISPEMSEEDFIHLIIEWCATSQYEENRIRDLSWNGEKEIRWGDDHCKSRRSLPCAIPKPNRTGLSGQPTMS